MLGIFNFEAACKMQGTTQNSSTPVPFQNTSHLYHEIDESALQQIAPQSTEDYIGLDASSKSTTPIVPVYNRVQGHCHSSVGKGEDTLTQFDSESYDIYENYLNKDDT